jgi:hypothetical protein
MADDIERAQEADARNRAAALAAHQARAAAAEPLAATGECRNPLCGEPVETPRLFCGPACAQQHARYSK